MESELCFEIYYVENVQLNLKKEDIIKLLNIKDLILFKKYLYYLNIFRMNYLYSSNIIEDFKEVINDDERKDELLQIFIKHDNLFCDEKGNRRLSLVPEEYKIRIVNY